MLKSKPITLKSPIFKASTKEIRARANALPVKSMIYAISHALADPHVKSEAASGPSKKRVATMARHLSTLQRMSIYLGNSADIDPSQLYGTIASSAHSYINLFYAMKPAARTMYIEVHSNNGISKRIKPENNLLIMPAIMAAQRERRSRVHSLVVRHLYAMPLRFIYTKARTAMRVELLEQAWGIKGAKDSSLRGFSATMKNIEALIEAISNGQMNPQSDERAKELFINHIVDVSEREEMGIAEFVSEKLATSNVSFKIARRVMRK